jgi:hypothetical protein
VQETLSITDRAYLLFEGKILKQGTAEELASDEVVRRVYLGQNFELRRKNISNTNNFDRTGNVVNYSSLITYTERMLNANSKMQEVIKESGGNKTLNRLVNGGLEDFLRSMTEYKTMLTSFAETQNNSNLQNLAKTIKPGNGPKKISLYLEYVPVAGNLLGEILKIASTLNTSEKYSSYFGETQSILNRIASALRVAAAENQPVLK